MLSAVVSVMAVFLFLLFIWLISYYSMKRKRKAYIHEKFGKIPKIREWNDALEYLTGTLPEQTARAAQRRLIDLLSKSDKEL